MNELTWSIAVAGSFSALSVRSLRVSTSRIVSHPPSAIRAAPIAINDLLAACLYVLRIGLIPLILDSVVPTCPGRAIPAGAALPGSCHRCSTCGHDRSERGAQRHVEVRNRWLSVRVVVRGVGRYVFGVGDHGAEHVHRLPPPQHDHVAPGEGERRALDPQTLHEGAGKVPPEADVAELPEGLVGVALGPVVLHPV